jgi:hypothetical protein
MQILSYFNELFKIVRRKNEYVVYGPNEIPKWHPLYGEKYYSWGTYERRLFLQNGKRVTVIVKRFYLPEKRKTYSLLPFYISPYQRHINKVIELCIIQYIRRRHALEAIARDPSPKYRTVRRWVRRFIQTIDHVLEKFELFLSTRIPAYRVADRPLRTIRDKVDYLYDNAGKVFDKSTFIPNYGLISYIYQAVAVEEAKL